MGSDHQEHLADSFFYIKQIGTRAVIAYPALTTPALVDSNGQLTIIIIVHEESFKLLTEHESENREAGFSFIPGEIIPACTAAKFHAQLLLTPWGNAHAQQFHSQEHCTHFFNDINTWQYTIYGKPDNAVAAYNEKKYKAYYLCDLKEDVTEQDSESYSATIKTYPECLVSIFSGDGGKQKPFGVIASAAAQMYYTEGYKHIFQLQFGDCFTEERQRGSSEGLFELLWLCAPLPAEHEKHRYDAPSDTVLLKTFADTLNICPGKEPTLLKENVGTSPQEILKGHSALPDELDLVTQNLYRLPRWETKEHDSSHSRQLTQGGALLYSYHPVWLYRQSATKIGAIADLHISTRQSLYPLTNAQVIPGANTSDSGNIGKTAHENLKSTQGLLKAIGEEVKIMLIAGDIYDHIRNIDPRHEECRNIKKTSELWKVTDFSKREDDYSLYPQYMDGLVMLDVIIDFYSTKKKPLFFIAGNHEGYRLPYGISPRLAGDYFKANEGIPADHNLTIYEAALLYGESYNDLRKYFNFSGKELEWIYKVFTPWSSFCVPHGHLNILGLGWGPGEDFLRSAKAGGGTLPRATESISPNQYELVQAAAAEEGEKTNILFSHFTHINYQGDMPLTRAADIKSLGRSDLVRGKANIGAYQKCFAEVSQLIYEKKIHYTISGHSHRAGVYQYTGTARQEIEVTGDESVNLYTIVPTKAITGSSTETHLSTVPLAGGMAVVSPSCGPMSCQNMNGEFRGLGMEKPGGVILDLEAKETKFTYWLEGCNQGKPRLAVLMAYLKDLHHLFPLEQKTTWKQGVPVMPKETGVVPVHIFLNLKNGEARAWLNTKLVDIFEGNPINEVRLHVARDSVDTSETKPEYFSIDFGATEKVGVKKGELLGNLVGARHGLKTIILKMAEKSSSNKIFAGIHLSQENCEKNLERYDTASPWCMPAKLVQTSEISVAIQLDFRELPEFKKMKTYLEFKK